MAQMVRIEYYGMDGEGRTITEAKRDAGEKIERALRGNYNPTMRKFGNALLLTWREPKWGYTYKVVDLNDTEYNVYGCTSYDTPKDRDRAAMRHMAQWIFDARQPETAKQGLALLDDRNDYAEHLYWCTWQFCYRAWLDAGETNDTKIREMAPRIWPEGARPWTLDD